MASKTALARLTLKKAKLSLVLPTSNEPPSEFRIFRKGVNKTSKGDFLFDDDAARQVMAAYRKHGVDVMIDLEHLSLDSESNNYDPSAYGWCKLELRGGELWAVGVTWTTAGAKRLRDKESRYISPAFHYLTENGRVTEIYNIAICAVPATYETPALVAASKRVGKQLGTLTIEVGKMDIKKILAALQLGEDATLEDVLNAIKALKDGDGGGGSDDEENADDDEPADDDEETSEDDDDEEATADSLKDLPPKVQAKILASLGKSKALTERIAKLEKKHGASARDALITANADKLPKSLEKWARKQTAETLAEYFKDAVPVKKEPKTPPKHESTGGGSIDVKLTPEDRKVCRLTGTKEEDFLKEKKRLADKRKSDAEIAAAG